MTESYCPDCNNRWIKQTSTSKCTWCTRCSICLKELSNMVKCCGFLRCETCNSIHIRDWSENKHKHFLHTVGQSSSSTSHLEQLEKEEHEVAINTNFEGFVFQSTINAKELKQQCFILMTDSKQYGKHLKQPNIFIRPLFALAAASDKYTHIAAVQVEGNVYIHSADCYSVSCVTLGTVRDFDLKNYVQHIKDVDKCLVYYPQWNKYFNHKLNEQEIVYKNPKNIKYIEQTEQNVKQAIELNGETIEYVDFKFISKELCLSAIIQTPISYK